MGGKLDDGVEGGPVGGGATLVVRVDLTGAVCSAAKRWSAVRDGAEGGRAAAWQCGGGGLIVWRILYTVVVSAPSHLDSRRAVAPPHGAGRIVMW